MFNHSLHPFTLTCQAQQPIVFPEFPGPMLRGLFGNTLMQLEQKGKVAEVEGYKLSALLFDNRLSDTHPWHGEYAEPPRGYWFTLDNTGRKEFNTGEVFSFTFTLCGYYAEWFELLLPVFVEMGKTGLGTEKYKYRLISVTQHHPYNPGIIVWEAVKPKTINIAEGISYRDFAASQLTSEELVVYFESRSALSKQHDLYGGIRFTDLIEALAKRITLLSNLYCGSTFAWDEKYLQAARNIRIAESHLLWNNDRRYSTRKQEAAPVEGYTGMVRYTGYSKDLQRYLPLLLIGQYTHVGRNIVFGGGKYAVDPGCYRIV